METRARNVAAAVSFALISASCLWVAFAESPVLGTAVFSIVLSVQPKLMQRSSAAEAAPLPLAARVAIAVVLVAAVAGLAWSSATGNTRAHNEWFQSWEFRPAFAALLWLLYTGGLFVSVFRRARGAAMNDGANT
jgi:hypothetical protein